MKTRNKIFIGSGVVLLIMLIAGYGMVSASGPWGDPGRGFSPRFHERGFHSKFPNKDISDFILWRMDKKAEDLNLTEAQKAKYEEIKENMKTQFSEGMGDRQRLMEQFHEEMDKENPDVRYMVQTIKAKLNEMSGFANKNLDLLVDFYESLDSTQKRMIMDEIRDRMEYHQS
ncbi:MAG: Spy/CpxP family protein refolding chaperone [Deltaproteobacteria bacterium]|nr:Spy/CpxP family protein refolding chaperone [Deltaproteobacteria bacterium]